MKHTRSINLMLALVMAMWTPVWCCCASHASTSHASKSSPIDSIVGTDTCPKCAVKDGTATDTSNPRDSHSKDCPTCPHGMLHSWAKLDKSPELTNISTPPCFLFTLDRIAVHHVIIDAPRLVFAQDMPPDPADASLISLHCLLTI